MTEQTIKKHLRALRADAIDGEADRIVAHVACAMETAIRRVTERVVGRPSLAEEARLTAKIIKELQP